MDLKQSSVGVLCV